MFPASLRERIAKANKHTQKEKQKKKESGLEKRSSLKFTQCPLEYM